MIAVAAGTLATITLVNAGVVPARMPQIATQRPRVARNLVVDEQPYSADESGVEAAVRRAEDGALCAAAVSGSSVGGGGGSGEAGKKTLSGEQGRGEGFGGGSEEAGLLSGEPALAGLAGGGEEGRREGEKGGEKGCFCRSKGSEAVVAAVDHCYASAACELCCCCLAAWCLLHCVKFVLISQQASVTACGASFLPSYIPQSLSSLYISWYLTRTSRSGSHFRLDLFRKGHDVSQQDNNNNRAQRALYYQRKGIHRIAKFSRRPSSNGPRQGDRHPEPFATQYLVAAQRGEREQNNALSFHNT